METSRCCGLTMGGSERAVEGLIARLLTLQCLGISCPARSGFGGRGWPPRGSPEGARFPKVQVGGQGGSQATAAPPAQHPHPGNWKEHGHPSQGPAARSGVALCVLPLPASGLGPSLSLAESQTQGRPWVLMT